MNTRKGLLKTKLFVPRAKDGFIARPALSQQFETGRRVKLTLLTAPAGFGKSVALGQWIAATDLPVGWLSLNAGENSPHRFLAYLTAAIQSVRPGVGEEILDLLDLPDKPPLDYLLSLLVNELLETEEMGLVLDDYHLIDNAEVHSAVAFLLQHLPGQVHLYLASRSEPADLPLARLRAQRELHEIKGNHLGFTREDTRAFFQAGGLELPEASLEALYARTEGWGLSLQLALLALQDAPDPAAAIRGFSGTHRYLMDYLLKDIFTHLPAPLQEFLLKTSLVSSFNADLCQALTGQPHCQDLIDQAEKQNLLLIPLDNRREWYRYHHLFAEWLQDRLRREKEGELADLHRRAAHWYAGRESWDEATEHILAAGDFEQAEAWLEQLFLPKQRQGQLRELGGWMQQLPEEQLLGNSKLAICYTLTLLDNHQKEIWLEKIEQFNARRGSLPPEYPLLANLAMARADIALDRQDPQAMLQHAKTAMQQASPGDSVMLSHIYPYLAVAYYLQGAYDKAWEMFGQIQECYRSAGNVPGQIVNQTQQTLILKMWCQFAEAERQLIATEAQALAHGLNRYPILVLLTVLLAEIYYYRNQLDLMQAYLAKTHSSSRHWKHNTGKLAAAFLNLTRGDLPAAEAWLLELEDHGAQPENAFAMQVYAVRAYASLCAGRREHLAEYIRVLAGYLAGKSAAQNCLCTLSLLYCLLAGNQLEQAFALTVTVLAELRAIANKLWELRFLVLQAVVLLRQGQLEQARSTLIQALQIGQPEHYIRPFADEWINLKPHIEAILARAVRGQVQLDPAYLKVVLKAFETAPARRPLEELKTQPESPLSERELEILRMLENGLSTQEISQQLVVSPNTTKTHLKNIYRKLEASSREQALTRAYQLSLL